jgi:NAD(P)H-hydrate epimerase
MNAPAANWSLPADARSAQALLDVAAARAVDRAAIAAGTAEIDMMERAGAATAAAILKRWRPCRALVLTGPGNNGGDGFVVARLLKAAGWAVRVAAMAGREALKGSAAIMANRWDGECETFGPDCLGDAELVVDALFGTGLARPLEGVAHATIKALNARTLKVVAVDIPSGIESDTGAILGAAVRADLTVTFFRRKPGQVLMPGRSLCGAVEVAYLGASDAVLKSVPVRLFVNDPALWVSAFPWPGAESQKYTRGHALLLGGTAMTGAGRLAAHAAQRIGAGLLTIAADPSVTAIYAAWRADLMVTPVANDADFRALLSDPRINAVLLGPGSGADARLQAAMGAALDSKAGLVFDADCFRILADRANGLLRRLDGRVLMTPHEGEFARVFGKPVPRLPSALRAARETGATILLKGADTIVAGADGGAVMNVNAPPDLATAGSGDVLAGLALGLTANHLPPMPAGAMACWIHGRAASLFGPGLVAEDIAELVPNVLKELREVHSESPVNQ